MSLRIDVVDAFTDTPFRGNPAAVCVLDSWRPDAWLQSLALEMSLSETAFLVSRGEVFELRWFTPQTEVALCGHATLASAHVLWQRELLSPSAIARFTTQSGELTARRASFDGSNWIELDFPAKPVEKVPPPAGLLASLGLAALGAEALFVGRNQFDYLVEVASESAVRDLAPNFSELAKIRVRGVMVTARSSENNSEFAFVSRFFAPAVGVNEDPVTGSAHCALTPYWAAKLGQSALTAYQASARGGVLRLRLEKGRVILGGQAVTTLRGELAL